MYKITLNLKPEFVTKYRKIKEFTRYYKERVMEIYAQTEPLRVTQFEFNGHSYSSALGVYKMDGTAIRKADYEIAINAYRDALKEALKRERNGIVSILRVKQTDATKEYYNYQVTTLYDEIMLQLNTYATKHERDYDASTIVNGTVTSFDQYTSCKDVFYFNDNITPMIAYNYLRRVYPHFMDFVTTFTLMNKDETKLLTNFLLLDD